MDFVCFGIALVIVGLFARGGLLHRLILISRRNRELRSQGWHL